MLAKERIIYDNYDLTTQYPDSELKLMAVELGWVADESEISDEDLWRWRYEENDIDWEASFESLKEFFKGKTVGFFGSVGLWHGAYRAGKIGDFEDLFYSAIKDCDYVKFYDENGHLYLKCTHHDGSCHFEIKILTDKGSEYLERWEDNLYDKRKESYIHDQIAKRYSRIPNYAHKVFGLKAREYEPESREGFLRMLGNRAVSFYS